MDELPKPGESPVAFALRAARDKAREVSRRNPDRPVLASDTVVELEGHILGKPNSRGEAVEMLSSLSGRRHRVHTAVAIRTADSEASLVDTAEVVIRPLAADQIEWYVATGEPMDKAGAYAVQGCAGLFVQAVVGSPHTVVGLPLHRLEELFAAVDLDLWDLLNGGSEPRFNPRT